MVHTSERAFILPYALLMGSVLLVLAMLFIQQGEHRIQRMEAEFLRSQAGDTLRLNVQPLIKRLERTIAGTHPASALIPSRGGSPGIYQSFLIGSGTGAKIPLCSGQMEKGESITFTTGYSEAMIEAGLIPFSPQDTSPGMMLAWTLQDLTLAPTEDPPPGFWPLPDWYWSPSGPVDTVAHHLDDLTHGQWQEGPWLEHGESLPFRMESSPAFVPVVEELHLRLGIFATGPVRSREKTIRARYFLEGRLWNPYNRPLQVHYGSGLRSIFQLVFYNLPEVRIINLDRGVSTSWIRLDETENDYTGKSGFHGWIRLPPVIEAGQRLGFLEPDSKWQPEGLARTLHPAFMIGPGDHIKVEFRGPQGGIYAACVPIGEADPLTAALDGAGWFRVEGFPIASGEIDFNRADDGDRPFFLGDGSLAFRRENAHLDFVFAWQPKAINGLIDSRRKILNHEDGHGNPDGGWTLDRDLVEVRVDQLAGLESGEPDPPGPEERTPLFSWPEHEPESLIEASDLPQWQSGFRLGSPQAVELNKLLDKSWAWALDTFPQSQITLHNKEGVGFPFRKMIPVNLLSAAKWSTLLENTSLTRFPLKFASYPWVNPERPGDFAILDNHDMNSGVRLLLEVIGHNPSGSVSDFFNRGILADSMSLDVPNSSLHNLMPLRGWLRNAPMLRPHGNSWLLHFAVRIDHGGMTLWRTAMVWLLESGVGPEAHLEVVQFQWTDPNEHVQFNTAVQSL